mmetsp:Transcript_19177/g.55693  ORF Transcript_19177/g.55693 Transcript_19177/m.55693 type:complete len:243 (+) Transcript_19177:816-1544(+)
MAPSGHCNSRRSSRGWAPQFTTRTCAVTTVFLRTSAERGSGLPARVRSSCVSSNGLASAGAATSWTMLKKTIAGSAPAVTRFTWRPCSSLSAALAGAEAGAKGRSRSASAAKASETEPWSPASSAAAETKPLGQPERAFPPLWQLPPGWSSRSARASSRHRAAPPALGPLAVSQPRSVIRCAGLQNHACSTALKLCWGAMRFRRPVNVSPQPSSSLLQHEAFEPIEHCLASGRLTAAAALKR